MQSPKTRALKTSTPRNCTNKRPRTECVGLSPEVNVKSYDAVNFNERQGTLQQWHEGHGSGTNGAISSSASDVTSGRFVPLESTADTCHDKTPQHTSSSCSSSCSSSLPKSSSSSPSIISVSSPLVPSSEMVCRKGLAERRQNAHQGAGE